MLSGLLGHVHQCALEIMDFYGRAPLGHQPSFYGQAVERVDQKEEEIGHDLVAAFFIALDTKIAQLLSLADTGDSEMGRAVVFVVKLRSLAETFKTLTDAMRGWEACPRSSSLSDAANVHIGNVYAKVGGFVVAFFSDRFGTPHACLSSDGAAGGACFLGEFDVFCHALACLVSLAEHKVLWHM